MEDQSNENHDAVFWKQAAERHFKQIDHRSDGAYQYATLIINALITMNGGAIIAALSFLGVRHDGTIYLGILSLGIFGVAFSMALIAAIFAFHFNVEVTDALTQGTILKEGTNFTYDAATIKRIKYANSLRMNGVRSAYGSFFVSFLGFTTFLIYLVSLPK